MSSQATIEFGVQSVESFFSRMPATQLDNWIANYKRIIDIEEDRFEVPVYGVKHKKWGQKMPYPDKLGPGYLAAMKRGLAIAERVKSERFPVTGGNEGGNG